MNRRSSTQQILLLYISICFAAHWPLRSRSQRAAIIQRFDVFVNKSPPSTPCQTRSLGLSSAHVNTYLFFGHRCEFVGLVFLFVFFGLLAVLTESKGHNGGRSSSGSLMLYTLSNVEVKQLGEQRATEATALVALN